MKRCSTGIHSLASVTEKWEGLGSEVVGGTPEQFMQLVWSEADRLGVLVKELNIQLD